MARAAKQEYENGTSLKDIRTMIDEAYKDSEVPSTPTSMPEV
ncbi:hypothetical protein J7W16_20715 [Bacillus sp. YZJH907-2]|uniref:Uncharacterized protein n=1 Tax=Halalkalibacter suaedae TaxID=2822140 RepID=A0A941AR50_9BACI|nr:hypothetical protein [Bacillus suaedae]